MNSSPDSGDDSPLPCLYSNNSITTHTEIDVNPLQVLTSKKIQGNNKLSTQHKKTASNLVFSVQELARKYGIERLGFLTLTFADFVTDARESQKRLNSLNTNILKDRYEANIRVFERCKSGRIHYHLIVVLEHDIRTGFNFDEIKRHNYKSANQNLRNEWSYWRRTAKRYGFGRTELLPIKSTADGVAKYVGKYISKSVEARLPEDKGVRLVSYSKEARIGSTRFSFVSEGSREWRFKVSQFSEFVAQKHRIRKCRYEDLKRLEGKTWAWKWRDLILALPGEDIPKEIKNHKM
ncbi:MAG: replication endonuclease, partial [Bacteroidetes bacterium]|nr:replication endonuclease [Bacteroidota bacterium]